MSGMDKMEGQLRQHQKLARSGTLPGGGGAEDVESLEGHRGKVNPDRGRVETGVLSDGNRAKGKHIRWSNHHLPAEAAPDHGKCS